MKAVSKCECLTGHYKFILNKNLTLHVIIDSAGKCAVHNCYHGFSIVHYAKICTVVLYMYKIAWIGYVCKGQQLIFSRLAKSYTNA